MSLPVSFRNIARYCTDVARSVPLYEALGFRTLRAMEGFAMLQHESGLKLVLHEGEPRGELQTAIGFDAVGNDLAAACAHVEKAGWRLMRAPDPSDRGLFYVYGDLDGNPINVVGARPA